MVVDDLEGGINVHECVVFGQAFDEQGMIPATEHLFLGTNFKTYKSRE